MRCSPIKWRNFVVHFVKLDSMFDAPVRYNFPGSTICCATPRNCMASAAAMETGAQNLTWVLPAVTAEVLRFQTSPAGGNCQSNSARPSPMCRPR